MIEREYVKQIINKKVANRNKILWETNQGCHVKLSRIGQKGVSKMADGRLYFFNQKGQEMAKGPKRI